jgi:hypothetical protein
VGNPRKDCFMMFFRIKGIADLPIPVSIQFGDGVKIIEQEDLNMTEKT